MKSPVIAALIIVGLVACDSFPPQLATQSPVNDDYVGDAPISITVPTEGANFTKGTTIRATPTLQGEYVQAKYLDRTSEVPSRILYLQRPYKS